MKLKNTLLASALLSAAAFSVHAATELTPEQAAALKPYDRICWNYLLFQQKLLHLC